ncbi:error-prone DNA polymerase [Marinivivus vitaminiproducens]|uniref:error-prone DNA polymerase n=1 Tax=Marinivivus vitaminiproducens TaxID=3035935 RepID=UPI0027A651C1|nr:error-prone DNA polymerase [Geminicoccaceae bacterium SCSIO 64248]
MSYAELQVTTHFSFLRGASSCEELFATAALMGLSALGVVDRNSLAGMVRAHEAAKATGVRLVVGCRLDLADGTSLLAYPTDRAAYARLCRLLSLGKRRAGKGKCTLGWSDLAERADGLIAVLLPDEAEPALEPLLLRLARVFGDRAHLALTLRRRPNDALRLHRLGAMAERHGVATVVTGDVLYHEPGRRILQDVVTCIRLGCTIDDLGFRRERFADRHLKTPEEMARLFSAHPDALARTGAIVRRCRFGLDQLTYQYPHEVVSPGLSAQQDLVQRIEAGLRERYGHATPDAVRRQIGHELALIAERGYAPYFLTVDSIVRYAKSEGILCQGRGSAANSAVCYALGITSIDPVKQELLFERFISQSRDEPPDIDVDFEHERREQVIQWIYETYGRERAALCATVIRYRTRGAVRDVGKALGLPEDVTGALARKSWGWSNEGVDPAHARELGLDPNDRRLALTLDLSRQILGFPRHLSQHPGGFVLTEDRLDDLVPIEPAAMADRQVIEWDKDDIEALCFMKVDVLGLGMLGCMRRAFDLLRRHRNLDLDLATVPADDPATFAMIQKADTLGVFQIESRAQMAMLPRLKPTNLYDLVIEVAIVRPGPIQGDMVHPYLRRRDGLEPVDFPKPELEAVLGKTLGVPLFQEQAMRVAIECAGFTPSEADRLRRSMATFKARGGVGEFRDKLIAGMVANGYEAAFAERTFRQIEGFGSYGFPESHAASFAQIAYASSWMKCRHPDVFCTALLNAQPMGFYAPAQIVRDAREHGVTIRPVDANRSDWDCTLEPDDGPHFAVRLGLRMAKGLAKASAERIVAARGTHAYAGIDDLKRRSDVPVAALERLAAADGFRDLGLARREALWAIRALRDDPLPLFARAGAFAAEPEASLRPLTESREVVEDYASTRLSLRRHPVSFLRPALDRRRILPNARLADLADGTRVRVAGIVLVRQRPGSAKGVLFVTIEDETGIANLIVWPQVFQRFRSVVFGASMLGCEGRQQRAGLVIHVVADRLVDLSASLDGIGREDRGFPAVPGRADEVRHGGGEDMRGRLPLRTRARDIYVPDFPPDRSRIRVKTRDFR